MDVNEAIGKTCPFKSNMVHEAPYTDGQGKMPVPGYWFCNTTGCMSWQQDRNNQNEGYCKLIEAQFPTG